MNERFVQFKRSGDLVFSFKSHQKSLKNIEVVPNGDCIRPFRFLQAAKVACHNIKRYNADGSPCGAVAGGPIRLRGDACPAAARGHAGRARALLVRVRRSGFEAATSPPWAETLSVVEAVLPRWPSLSKRTTCQGWRAGERGEAAGAQAQPRARTLSPHGQPVSRAGSEKVLATRHRFENTRQDSHVSAKLSKRPCFLVETLEERGYQPTM